MLHSDPLLRPREPMLVFDNIKVPESDPSHSLPAICKIPVRRRGRLNVLLRLTVLFANSSIEEVVPIISISLDSTTLLAEFYHLRSRMVQRPGSVCGSVLLIFPKKESPLFRLRCLEYSVYNANLNWCWCLVGKSVCISQLIGELINHEVYL